MSRRGRVFARFIPGLVALLAGGCITTLPLGSARTVPRGTIQVHATQSIVRGEPSGTPDPDFRDAFAHPGYATPELGVVYGITDRVEAGARLRARGGGIGAKVAHHRAPSVERGIDVAVAAEAGVFGTYEKDADAAEGIAYAQVPLLVGVNLSGIQLVAGAHYEHVRGWGICINDGECDVDMAGGSLGVSIPVRNGLRLYPQLGTTWVVHQRTSPPQGANPTYWDPGDYRGRIVQVSLGFLLGGE